MLIKSRQGDVLSEKERSGIRESTLCYFSQFIHNRTPKHQSNDMNQHKILQQSPSTPFRRRTGSFYYINIILFSFCIIQAAFNRFFFFPSIISFNDEVLKGTCWT